jgi:hypothetical protein
MLGLPDALGSRLEAILGACMPPKRPLSRVIAFPSSKAAVSSYWAGLQNRIRLVTVEINVNPPAEEEEEEDVFVAADSESDGDWS